MSAERFSRRHGYTGLEPPIRYRDSLPHDTRAKLYYALDESPLQWRDIRRTMCRLRREMPTDEANEQVQGVLFNAEWYEILDLLEALAADIAGEDARARPTVEFPDDGGDPIETPPPVHAREFEEAINGAFREDGVGWELRDGQIQARSGSGPQDQAVRSAITTLRGAGLPTAASELEEALRDISRRPEPDRSGTVQHCVAALEIVARDYAGDSQSTLGQIAKANPNHMLPKPLDGAAEKIWGYASEWGRHMKEGKVPSFEEAELLLGLCASLVNYISRK